LYFYFNGSTFTEFFEKLTSDLDKTIFWCEFESIALQVQKDLLQSDFISTHKEPMVKINKLTRQVDAHRVSFLLLDHHDFSHAFLDVHIRSILAEFVRVDLSQAQNVIHIETQELG